MRSPHTVEPARGRWLRLGTAAACSLSCLAAGCGSDDEVATQEPPAAVSTDPNLKVAFIGDQGLNDNSVAVLQLIEDEGTDLVLHAGDFDYVDDPDGWDDQINSVLGDSYPYFACVGNHDISAWEDYRAKLEQRLAKIEGAECTGPEVGAAQTCTYRGLFFVLSGGGTWPLMDHMGYLAEALSGEMPIWRVCDWHKNRADLQVGHKDDEAALDAYGMCADVGALVATGHEHSYSRTLTLSAMRDPDAGYGATGEPDHMELGPGQTFVIVSGIAGQSLRDFNAEDHADDTWWANIYAGGHHLRDGEVSTNFNYTYGALFIDFHVDDDPHKARGYFKNIDGEIIDEFTITAP